MFQNRRQKICQPPYSTAAAAEVVGAAAAKWLRRVVGEFNIAAISGDAGHRKYFRVCADSGVFVLMIDKTGIAAFAKMREIFAKAMTVPQIIKADSVRGLCLLEDFGDVWYLQIRNKPNGGALYNAAIRALIKLQTMPPPAAIKDYDNALLRREMRLFDNWYCRRHLQQTLSPSVRHKLAAARSFLTAEIINGQSGQGGVLVHRDYHCRNLMVLNDRRSPGVLDFQDAVCGSPFYDMVSLLRDAYTYFPPAQQKKMLHYYCQNARAAGIALPQSFAECWRMFNIVGAQRGLKVLGIFARLVLRDGKRGFLRPMPLARRHLLCACRQVPQLFALGKLIGGWK